MAEIDPSLCPICGGPNQCAMALTGDAAACAGCWCANMKISADVLAKVPAAALGRACLCPSCGAVDLTPEQTPECADD